jgi:thiamine biosynthesis lipoprotein
MDTVVMVDTYSVDLTKEVQSKAEELNSIFDRHSEGTELYMLNTNKSLEKPSVYLNDLVSETLLLNERFGYSVDITSGALIDSWDITSDSPKVPTSKEISNAMQTIGTENISVTGNAISLQNGCILDFGAVAKGYTLDVICSMLDDYSPEKACISMGSSTLLYNVNDYTMGIRSPNDTNSVACEFTIDGTGYVSTSGGYERYMEIDGVTYSHILDLNTGCPSTTDLTSVTVYTDSGLLSDFLSTYIYLGGTDSISQYLHSDDYKVIAIDDNNNIYTSDGLNVNILDDTFSIS